MFHSDDFANALRKALLGPITRSLEVPKPPSLEQLVQGPMGVAGGPHGNPHGMWGSMFGSMTAQGLLMALLDDLIESLM